MAEPMENKQAQPRKDFHPGVVYAFCLGVSFVFMFFFGLNSPLHTFNDHCDYQWYMTMGHGMASGKVIYRDLFDHKGPLLYTLFMIAYLFPNPNWAIWCIEVLCVSLFLFFCYRIARKFLSPWLSLLVLPLTMMVLSTNYVRGLEGSCAEEYCFPIFAYGLLCFLDLIMDHKVGTWRRSLAIGICMGILFWVKFTMLEFFFVPLLIWLVINLKHRDWRRIMLSGSLMLAGFVLVTIPVIISFVALGALDDLFNVYFGVNIGHYDGNYEGQESEQDPLSCFGYSFLLGAFYIYVLIWGLICFAVRNWKQKSGWLLLIAALGTWLIIGFFVGYLYYYLPLYVYAVLGVIYAVKIVTYMLSEVYITIKRPQLKVVWLSVAVVVSFFAAYPYVGNIKEINRSREDHVQYVVADIIAAYNQTAEHPATLFCYHMADCGFYNAAGIVPNVRYYAQSSFTKENFPEMFASFDDTIREQICDFVVTYRYEYDDNEAFLTTYYHPYIDNDLQASTLPFVYFEPGHYEETEIVVLFRNPLVQE